jgi:hypothetical protein
MHTSHIEADTGGEMLQSFRFYWPAAILAIISVVCTPADVHAQAAKATQSANPPFSLTLSAVQPIVKAGSDVWVNVTLKNKSDHKISVYKENTDDQGGFVYQFNVSDDKGALVPETKFARRLNCHLTADELAKEPCVGLRSGGHIPVDPRGTMEDRMNVSRLHDLSQPGKYTIQVERYDDESKTFVKSNTITVIVTP